MIITIDGPAGAGKSTVARALAELGKQVSAETIERAFERASAEFAPRLVTRVVDQFVGNSQETSTNRRTIPPSPRQVFLPRGRASS